MSKFLSMVLIISIFINSGQAFSDLSDKSFPCSLRAMSVKNVVTPQSIEDELQNSFSISPEMVLNEIVRKVNDGTFEVTDFFKEDFKLLKDQIHLTCKYYFSMAWQQSFISKMEFTERAKKGCLKDKEIVYFSKTAEWEEALARLSINLRSIVKHFDFAKRNYFSSGMYDNALFCAKKVIALDYILGTPKNGTKSVGFLAADFSKINENHFSGTCDCLVADFALRYNELNFALLYYLKGRKQFLYCREFDNVDFCKEKIKIIIKKLYFSWKEESHKGNDSIETFVAYLKDYCNRDKIRYLEIERLLACYTDSIRKCVEEIKEEEATRVLVKSASTGSVSMSKIDLYGVKFPVDDIADLIIEYITINKKYPNDVTISKLVGCSHPTIKKYRKYIIGRLFAKVKDRKVRDIIQAEDNLALFVTTYLIENPNAYIQQIGTAAGIKRVSFWRNLKEEDVVALTPDIIAEAFLNKAYFYDSYNDIEDAFKSYMRAAKFFKDAENCSNKEEICLNRAVLILKKIVINYIGLSINKMCRVFCVNGLFENSMDSGQFKIVLKQALDTLNQVGEDIVLRAPISARIRDYLNNNHIETLRLIRDSVYQYSRFLGIEKERLEGARIEKSAKIGSYVSGIRRRGLPVRDNENSAIYVIGNKGDLRFCESRNEYFLFLKDAFESAAAIIENSEDPSIVQNSLLDILELCEVLMSYVKRKDFPNTLKVSLDSAEKTIGFSPYSKAMNSLDRIRVPSKQWPIPPYIEKKYINPYVSNHPYLGSPPDTVIQYFKAINGKSKDINIRIIGARKISLEPAARAASQIDTAA
ncbi:MAG: hypothetical protein ABIB11_04270 [Candidatus Omnitrophota bacterium]